MINILTDEEIIDAIHSNCIEFYKQIASSLNSSYSCTPNLFENKVPYAITGLSAMVFNSLFDGAFDDPSVEIPNIVNFFKKEKIPIMWRLSPNGQNKGWGKYLENCGLELAQMQVPGMAVKLNEIPLEELRSYINQNKIEIIEEMDQKEEISVEILIKSFNLSPQIKESLIKINKNMLDKGKIKLFLASYNDKISCTSTVFYSNNVAGLYHVATLEEMRNRGLAKAIVSRCMMDAIENGCQIMTLLSTPIGHPVYNKLGFENYFIYDRYLLRPEML